MGHKIAIRVKPLKQWSDVSNATRHGKREDPAKHVDRVRTHLNQHWRSMTDPENPEKRRLFRRPSPSISPRRSATWHSTGERNGARCDCWHRDAVHRFARLLRASGTAPGREGPKMGRGLPPGRDEALSPPDRRRPPRSRRDHPHFSVFMLPTYRKEYAGTGARAPANPA